MCIWGLSPFARFYRSSALIANRVYLELLGIGFFRVGMCLPAGPYVSDEDVKYIVDTIKSAIER